MDEAAFEAWLRSPDPRAGAELPALPSTAASILRRVVRDERTPLRSVGAARVAAEALGARAEAGWIAAHACRLALQEGDPIRAIQLGTEAVTRCTALADPDALAASAAWLGEAYVDQGDLPAAERVVRIAAVECWSLSSKPANALLRARYALIQALAGDSEPGIDAALQEARAVGLDAEVARLTALCATQSARGGDVAATSEALRTFEVEVAHRDTQLVREALIEAATAAQAIGHPDLTHRFATAARAAAARAGDRRLLGRADALLAADGGRAEPRRLPLLRLAADLAAETDLGRLLDRCGDAALELFDVDRAFIVLEEDGTLVVRSSRGRHGPIEARPSMAAVQRVLWMARTLLVDDARSDPYLGDARSIQVQDIGAVMCVPLRAEEQLLGVLYVDSQRATPGDLQLVAAELHALAGLAAAAVTAARRSQEQARRTQQAREVVHDLRNVMAAALYFAAELRDGELAPEELPQAAGTIATACREAVAIAESLLEDRPLTPRPLDLAKLNRRILRVLAPEARRRGVALRARGEPAPMEGDPLELGRVLTNLVHNALKYAPTGSTVDVQIRQEADHIDWTVRDEGPGIPEEELDDIFGPGHQAANAREGHGLGLATCARIVDEHRGSITADNHPRGGAILHVRLPRRASDE